MKNNEFTPQNILVSRTDKIGDIILTLPLISEIKRIYPESKVTFLIRKIMKDLLQGYEGIDDFMFIDDFTSESDLQETISERNFDTAFAVYPRFQIALAFYKADIRYRIGSAYRWYSFLFNIKIKEHRKFAIKHEYQYNLGLLRAITDKVVDNVVFHFRYSDEEKQQLRIKLLYKGINTDSDFIIVHPGSRASAKDLPLDILIKAVIEFLDITTGINIFFTGQADESEIINKIVDSIPENNRNRIFSLEGMLTLREMMILIDSCKVFVSNSTGPIHIAGALNKNIVGFYPETPPMGPVRWKPLSDSSIILTPNDSYDSMESIRPEKIAEAIKELL